jgi:hypothetical protein
MSRTTQIALLTFVLLLTVGTRILHIAEQSLWIDEGITYFNITSPDLINTLVTTDVHPPLYFWLLQGWVTIAGGSVFSMRMFSALFSILAVALIVPFTRLMTRPHAWFSHRLVPVLAALMLMLSDPDVVLAQDVRMYTLRTCLILLSMIFYLRWIERPQRWNMLGWLLSSVLMLYTQYQSGYVLVVQGLHALLFLHGALRLRAVGVLTLIALLFAPWAVGVAVQQRNNDFGVAAALPSNWTTFVQLTQKYLSSQWALVGALLLLGTVRLLDGKRLEWRPLGSSFILVFWVVFSLVISFILNLFYPVVLAPHRLLLISPPIAVLIAQGLRNIRAPERWVLVAAIVIFGLSVVDDYYPKEPWDDMARSATQYSHPEDMALLELFRGDNPVTYYLDWETGNTLHVESLRKRREYSPAAYPEGLLDVLATYDGIWFFHWSDDQSGFEFLQQTDHVRTALLTTNHIGNALNVYRYDRLPAGEIARFENGMILRAARLSSEDLRVELWWTTESPLPLDYSVSTFLLDSGGQLVAQHDSYPFEGRRPTTGWNAGEIVYDPHPLAPTTLPPGRYTAAVQLYTWFDGVRYPVVTGEDWAVVGHMDIGD